MNRLFKSFSIAVSILLLASCASQRSTPANHQSSSAGYDDLDEKSQSLYYCTQIYKLVASGSRAINKRDIESQMMENQALALTLFFANVQEVTGWWLPTARQIRELRIVARDIEQYFFANMETSYKTLASCNELVDGLLETDLEDVRPNGLEFYEAVNLSYKSILEDANSN